MPNISMHAGTTAPTGLLETNHCSRAMAAGRQGEEPSTSEPSCSLPVVESVLRYEKLHRIGEGTYGVVCESWACTHQVLLASSSCRRGAERTCQTPSLRCPATQILLQQLGQS